ncbi:MAG: hypothetical protein QME42_07065 [bacterium]|nr:hypothetical protein [bacterium]
MNEQFLKLSQRIREEATDLEQVLHRIQEGWQRAQIKADDYYLDGVALNLHGLYAGLERLFERIAAIVEQHLPQGANWHKKLLDQMASEQPGLRPAVISTISYQELDEYRGFRHVVQNVYAFRFNPAKLQHLVEQSPTMFSQVRQELLAFANFIGQEAGTP